jgi:hypothetical protein
MTTEELITALFYEPMVLVSDKPNSNISILQTKLRNGEGHEARCVGLETMPLDEDIEGGDGEREPRLKIPPTPMHHLLQMADQRQHREHRLHQHAILPRAALAEFQVSGIALRGMKAGVAKDNHTPVKLPNQPLKGIICDIGRATRPPHDQPALVQHEAQFAPDNPTRVRHAFATDLLRAAALTHGVDQLDPVGVDNPEHGRSGQEDPGPVLMGPEEAKEPGALGEVGKQRAIVARYLLNNSGLKAHARRVATTWDSWHNGA